MAAFPWVSVFIAPLLLYETYDPSSILAFRAVSLSRLLRLCAISAYRPFEGVIMCLAIPVQIQSIDASRNAVVELGGVTRQISLIMTPEAEVGNCVLVHTGYAISVLSEEEALASLEAFAELARIQAEMEMEHE